jgi:hypothetical protein
LSISSTSTTSFSSCSCSNVFYPLFKTPKSSLHSLSTLNFTLSICQLTLKPHPPNLKVKDSSPDKAFLSSSFSRSRVYLIFTFEFFMCKNARERDKSRKSGLQFTYDITANCVCTGCDATINTPAIKPLDLFRVVISLCLRIFSPFFFVQYQHSSLILFSPWKM